MTDLEGRGEMSNAQWFINYKQGKLRRPTSLSASIAFYTEGPGVHRVRPAGVLD
jgi:hypothetical protein